MGCGEYSHAKRSMLTDSYSETRSKASGRCDRRGTSPSSHQTNPQGESGTTVDKAVAISLHRWDHLLTMVDVDLGSWSEDQLSTPGTCLKATPDSNNQKQVNRV